MLKEHPELLEKLNDESDENGEEDLRKTSMKILKKPTMMYRFTKKHKFPPAAPIYTVQLTETLNRNYECLETAVSINEKSVRSLKARVNSIRADVAADRVFIQTLYSENDDSFSIFCFELSTNRLLWQTSDIPPSGILYIDKERQRVEAGATNRDYADNYLVLLDYDGNILERNFRSGYEMRDAAHKHFRTKNTKKLKNCFYRY